MYGDVCQIIAALRPETTVPVHGLLRIFFFATDDRKYAAGVLVHLHPFCTCSKIDLYFLVGVVRILLLILGGLTIALFVLVGLD